MALLTSCPECHTTFRISEEALRKAAGQVRCGRCSNIFNAHAQLRDSEDAPKPRPASGAAPAAAPVPSARAPDWPDIIDLLQPDAEARTLAVASTSDPSADEAFDPEAPVAPPPDAENGTGVSHESDLSRDRVAETILNPAPEAAEVGSPDVAKPWTFAQLAAALGPDRTRLWKLGVVFAGVVLLVQVANSFSDVLATRVPFVQSVYAALGVTLVPRWNLDRYEVLGATAATNKGESGRGNLVISARIRNRGTLAQPYPHVQLRLLDRWERTVGRRAFTPASYSATSVSPDAMIAPGASITAELVVVDPGPDAAGFEIDVCVDGAAGLRCDGDQVFE
jgi:predicted Zn finger-like uncharacterized protein